MSTNFFVVSWGRAHPDVVGGTVAAAILAAVEGAHPAARTCARSSAITGAFTPVPPGRMPRLYVSQDGRRYQQLRAAPAGEFPGTGTRALSI